MIKALKAGIKFFFRARGYCSTRIKGKVYRFDPDHIKFWHTFAKGAFEPSTLTFLSDQLKPDSVYCDIGAWIGPTAIHAAMRCKHVLCFEPDPVAFRYLLLNIKLNGFNNVSAFNLAISDRTSFRTLFSRGKSGLGNTMSTLRRKTGKSIEENTGAKVLTLDWGTVCEADMFPKIDVMKIDIEGSEFDLLPGLEAYIKKCQPTLCLSTHPHLLDPSVRQTKMMEVLNLIKHYKRCVTAEGEAITSSESINDGLINKGQCLFFTN